MSSTKSQMSLSIAMQSPQEDLIADTIIILNMIDLRQPDLPWRIALKVNIRSKQHQKVRLTHHALHDLGIHELLCDIVWRELLALRHLRQGFCEVDECGSSVFGG